MSYAKEFFQAALQYRGEDCLLWPFARSPGGYAKVSTGKHGKCADAHRMICERAHGPPPFPRAVAAHWCGKKLCLTPAHIRWTTQKENIADKKQHGTYTTGAQMPWSKLTDEAVKDIRNNKGPLKAMAEKYSVTVATISHIKLRKSWKHL